MTASSDSSSTTPIDVSQRQPSNRPTLSPKRSSRPWWSLFALALLAGGIGFIAWRTLAGRGQGGMQGPPAFPVEMERLQESSLENSAEFVGTLDSLYTQLGESEAIAAGVDLQAEDFDFFGNLGEAFSTIPANLAALSNQLLDPLGLSVGEITSLEDAATEQTVAFTTFGQMSLRFDGQAGAFAYLLFVLMYFPCAAAMGAVYRETNAGWTAFVGLWTTGLAYWSAVLYYQSVTFRQHPISSAMWIVGVAIALGVTFALLQFAPLIKRRKHRSSELLSSGAFKDSL